MKIVRILLFPVVPIYFAVTWCRNWLYNIGLKTSKSYAFPVISVGNLSTGGTGKTPMIEYLISILQGSKQVATLSRGYKRNTKGFVLADDTTDAMSIGDEPFQIYSKYNEKITVAVDANRQHGIAQLRQLQPQPNVVLLDDAYQHRKVRAGLNILLTAHHKLYINDIVLPTGNLREPRQGAKRADIIVVTKCPSTLSNSKKLMVIQKLQPLAHQQVFFSTINYDTRVKGLNGSLSLDTLPEFTLVTGIANALPLVRFLSQKKLEFQHLEYADHYNFTSKDISVLDEKQLIITTEKDYMRLKHISSLKQKLYYIPITITLDKQKAFNEAVLRFANLKPLN